MFRLDDLPRFYPGTTVLGNTAGPVVYCGDLPAGGAIYHDRIEAAEIARHFGFVTPEEHQRVIAQLDAAVEAKRATEEKLANVRGMVAAA